MISRMLAEKQHVQIYYLPKILGMARDRVICPFDAPQRFLYLPGLLADAIVMG